jgi:hypothetical protein
VRPYNPLERVLDVNSRWIVLRLLAVALVSLSIIVAAGIACSPAASPGSVSPAPKPIANPTAPSKPTIQAVQAASTAIPAATITPRSQAVATVTVQKLKELMESEDKPQLFDARSRSSYDTGHIPGAISLPLDELENRLSEVSRERLAIFYCTGST